MKFRVEVICVHDDGAEQRCDMMEMERHQLAMETLGLSLVDGKTILHEVQDFVASQQMAADLKGRRICPSCGQRYHSKATGTHTVKTVFGPVSVPNPRWERCSCQTEGPKTFRPAAWLRGRTSPELLYLETKWGSLIPFEKVADLLKEVLPVGEATNHETVREHLYAIAERIEAELGEERPTNGFECQQEQGEQRLPDGPMTVGIDGGYVRASHKEGCFEVIAGRSVVAFRRTEEDPVPPPKCFGFVQTFDQKSRRRRFSAGAECFRIRSRSMWRVPRRCRSINRPAPPARTAPGPSSPGWRQAPPPSRNILGQGTKRSSSDPL